MQEFFAFLALLFIIENSIFAIVGIGTMLARWFRSSERWREERETERRRIVAEEERQKEIQALRGDMTSLKEMMADLLLEIDRPRRTSAETKPHDSSASNRR